MIFKNTLKNKKIKFIFGFLILFIINIFSSAFGQDIGFYLTGLFNFVLSYYLLKINPFKKIGYPLVFLYFFLVFPVMIHGLFIVKAYIGLLKASIYYISSFSSILVYTVRTNKLKIALIYLLVLVFLSINFNNMFNFYMAYLYKNEMVGKNLPQITIYDSRGNGFLLSSKEKILVVDLWSNSCGYCIQAFPEFEKLKNHFKNDKAVEFLAINVDEKKINRKRGLSYIEKFTFKNYFVERDILKKLNFSQFPNYMIVGKDGKIKYFGDLNMDELETYNNIYKLIENEK